VRWYLDVTPIDVDGSSVQLQLLVCIRLSVLIWGAIGFRTLHDHDDTLHPYLCYRDPLLWSGWLHCDYTVGAVSIRRLIIGRGL
jgi:hypothetical protein